MSKHSERTTLLTFSALLLIAAESVAYIYIDVLSKYNYRKDMQV